MSLKGRRFLEFGGFRLDPDERVVYRGDDPVALTPKAVETLLTLVANAGRIVDKSALMQAVWRDTFVEEGNLSQQIFHLRRALGDQPDGQPYIETVPRRGFRFVADVVDTWEEGQPTRRRGWRRGAGWAAAAAAMLALAITVALWARAAPHPGNSASGRVMIAVLPFDTIGGDPRDDYFSDGLTEEMINRLARLNPARLSVIARTSAMLYKDSQKTIEQIGRELGVDWILEGTVRRSGGRVRVSAQLIEVSDQTHRWASNFDDDSREVLGLQKQIAEAVGRELSIVWPPAAPVPPAQAELVDPRVLTAFFRGRHTFNQLTDGSLQEAIGYFTEALRIQADYAPAYVGLADSYLMEGFRSASGFDAWSKAAAYASKAVELDASAADAHRILAMIRMRDWDWHGAEQEFRTALELNASSSAAYDAYSRLLQILGRHEEAIAAERRAIELDPLAHVSICNLGFRYYRARQYDAAIDQARRSLQVFPDCPWEYLVIGDSRVQQGSVREAIAAFEKSLDARSSTRGTLGLAYAYAAAGDRAAATNLLQELSATQTTVDPYLLAPIYVALDDHDEAFRLLHRAYEQRSLWLPFVNVEPKFDPLHGDPRFDDLLRAIGLR